MRFSLTYLCLVRILVTETGTVFCRLESASNKEDTVAFLAGLETLWNGYIDMPSVARYLTKAYPVSGILDHLIEVSVMGFKTGHFDFGI